MTVFCIRTMEVWPLQIMNQSIQQMGGTAVAAVTESALSSYICCINRSSKKPLQTCDNFLDWLSECKLLWRAASQTDQNGLWVVADRHPRLLRTIKTLITLHASNCKALPFERGNQTAVERLNNHAD